MVLDRISGLRILQRSAGMLAGAFGTYPEQERLVTFAHRTIVGSATLRRL